MEEVSSSPWVSAERPAPRPQRLSLEGEAALRGWMDAGNLPDLRWPNFSDYRVHVKNLYEPAGYVLAWVRDGHPTPQAVAITEVFQVVDRKGLVPDDYDSLSLAGTVRPLRSGSDRLPHALYL